jgi:hypothetical protein
MGFGDNLKSVVQSNVKNFTSDLENTVKSTATNFANNALNSALGSGAAGILRSLLNGPSSTPALRTSTPAKVAGTDADWRVRLSLPSVFANDETMKPIIETNGLVFPYTPTILIQHTANYDAMQPTHSNYPFPQYQNSQIEDIVITGDFFCENAVDAQYWAATLHYLRSVTKMFYGQSSNAGAPPPIVHLNGYGDFVFPNVPVVVKNFTVDLPADVDYIKTQMDGVVSKSVTTSVNGFNEGWAPVQSQVSVTVGPIYSRAKTSQFSLDDFVKGEYLGSGQNGGGFV